MAVELEAQPGTRLTTAERRLVRLAVDMGAESVGGPLSPEERSLAEMIQRDPAIDTETIRVARLDIRQGADPLGEELLGARPSSLRRVVGAFYTPPAIVDPMVAWIMGRSPSRVIDAGCGSGRFACAVARHQSGMSLVAVDLDPVATLIARANLATVGAQNARVIHGDYTALTLDGIDGRTAFVGNPPYVRHHDLSPETKAWAADAGKRLGQHVSTLAGLHAYFFLATALLARPGDFGTFITSSEWLDVGYGSAIRELLLGRLGGLSLTAFDPRTSAFTGVMTTAVVVSFEAGARPESVQLNQARGHEDLNEPIGLSVPREALATATRWSPLFAWPSTKLGMPISIGPPVRLGDIARVHRGQVTGANEFFVMSRERAKDLGLLEWCRPVISSAREVLSSGGVVLDQPERKVLLCAPRDLDRRERPALDRFLQLGEQTGPGRGIALMDRYVPRHRTPWWYLGRIPAPPIVASYMARRAPAFALNPDGLALLNIGHGLWPKAELAEDELAELVSYLNSLAAGFRGEGRTYHGGLEKFEPSEMEALRVPGGERFRR